MASLLFDKVMTVPAVNYSSTRIPKQLPSGLRITHSVQVAYILFGLVLYPHYLGWQSIILGFGGARFPGSAHIRDEVFRARRSDTLGDLPCLLHYKLDDKELLNEDEAGTPDSLAETPQRRSRSRKRALSIDGERIEAREATCAATCGQEPAKRCRLRVRQELEQRRRNPRARWELITRPRYPMDDDEAERFGKGRVNAAHCRIRGPQRSCQKVTFALGAGTCLNARKSQCLAEMFVDRQYLCKEY